MADIQNMLRKEVEILANGTKYVGILIEVSDEEVQLQGPLQWITLPMSAVSEIKLKKK